MKSILIKSITIIQITSIIINSLPITSTSSSDPKDNEKIISLLSKNSFLEIFNIKSIFDTFLSKKPDLSYSFLDEQKNKISLIQNNFNYNTTKFELNVNKAMISFGFNGNIKKEDGLLFNFSLSVKPNGNANEVKCLINGKTSFLLYTNVFYGVFNLTTITSSRIESIQLNLEDSISDIDKNSIKCIDDKKKTDYSSQGYIGMMTIIKSEKVDYFEPFKSLINKIYERDDFINIFSPMQVTVSKSQKVNIQLKYQRFELHSSNSDYMIIYHLGNVDKPNIPPVNKQYEYKDFPVNLSEQQSFLSIGFLNEILSLKHNSDYIIHSKFIENDPFYMNLTIEKIGSFIPEVYNLYMMHHKVILTTQYSIRECNIVKSTSEKEEFDLSVRSKFTIEIYLANTEDVIIVINFNVRHKLLIVNVDKSNNLFKGESNYFNLLLTSIEFEYINIEKYDFEVIIRSVHRFFKPLIEKYFEKEQFLFLTPIGISKSIDFGYFYNSPRVVDEGVVINSILGVRKDDK